MRSALEHILVGSCTARDYLVWFGHVMWLTYAVSRWPLCLWTNVMSAARRVARCGLDTKIVLSEVEKEEIKEISEEISAAVWTGPSTKGRKEPEAILWTDASTRGIAGALELGGHCTTARRDLLAARLGAAHRSAPPNSAPHWPFTVMSLFHFALYFCFTFFHFFTSLCSLFMFHFLSLLCFTLLSIFFGFTPFVQKMAATIPLPR